MRVERQSRLVGGGEGGGGGRGRGGGGGDCGQSHFAWKIKTYVE